MKSALVLRPRMMPFMSRQQDILSQLSWRKPNPFTLLPSKQQHSSAEASRPSDDNILPPSMVQESRASEQDRGAAEDSPDKHRQSYSNSREIKAFKLKLEDISRRDAPSTHSKRKADPAPDSRATRPWRGRTKTELKDETYIRNNFHVLTREEAPYLPPAMFENPKATLHNAMQGRANLNFKFSMTRANQCHCDLTFEAPNQHRQVFVGEGTSKRTAEKAACLRLLAELYENGVLRQFFDKNRGDVVDKISKDTLQREVDAKMDIYNYAARHDCIPTIHMRMLNRPYRSRGQQRKLVEITVQLPEQDLEVTAIGESAKRAEVAAGIKFKQEAEKYHAQHGRSSIVINDPTVLNTSNAQKFFDFYKIVNKVSVDVETTTEEVQGSTSHRSQVRLDGKPIGECVDAFDKRGSEVLAFLTAAISLKRENPSLYPQFVRALKAGNGNILKPVPPITMLVDEDCVLDMRETLVAARKAGLPDEQDELPPDEDVRTGRMRLRSKSSPHQEAIRRTALETSYQQFLENPGLADLRKQKESLPMNQYRNQVLDLVDKNTYSIIVGATGSGKTTQVPQILFENAIRDGRGEKCNIICTQPRRIAATSVARRVASERAEDLQDSVGYQVRFDARLPKAGGSITYCTTGILLQQLQNSPNEVLDNNSYLIIDEVHERDTLIDFLLIILKKTIAQRIAERKPTPKVVLMSATMDTDLFASYFKDSGPTNEKLDCPSLSVPGRTFPVKETYLDDLLKTLNGSYSSTELYAMRSDRASNDYLDNERSFVKASPAVSNSAMRDESTGEAVIEWKRERLISADGGSVSNEKEDNLVPYGLVAMTVAHIVKTSSEGAILVFVPGLDEITKVDALLRAGVLGIDFNNEAQFKVFALHSSLPGAQTEVFEKVPANCRKIILATNIAETSVTIPDVQFVVDTGKLREKQYDQIRRITKLQCTWISKSNSKQRAGRAGRVQNGNYYALFSRNRFDSLRAIGLPEILRADLQEICLAIKAQAFQMPIREFLAEAIEPPAPSAVDASVLNLQALDALTDDEKLTPLGRILASLPVHPSLGKMIVLGIIFRCLDSILILGASSEARNLFVNPLDNRRAATEVRLSFSQGTGSDHIATLNAVHELRRLRDTKGQQAVWDFARQNFLHVGAFRNIDATAKQIEDILVEAGLVPFTPPQSRQNSQYGDPSLNINSSKIAVIKALMLAGLHPNLALGTGGPICRTPGERATLVHPTSVNAPEKRAVQPNYDTLFAYTQMTRSNDGNTIFLRDTSAVTPLMATLFGGRLTHNGNIIEMDQWLPFYVRSRDNTAVKTIMEFRKALERLLIGAFRQLRAKKFLADEEVTEVFADGLVDVLRRDLGKETAEMKNARFAAVDAWKKKRSGMINKETAETWFN